MGVLDGWGKWWIGRVFSCVSAEKGIVVEETESNYTPPTKKEENSPPCIGSFSSSIIVYKS